MKFLLSLLLFLVVCGFASSAVQAAASSASPSVTPKLETAPSSNPAPAQDIDYALPYPGLLPDSPLYILKIWRDQFLELLISDRSQKGFYFLHLSDKRLASGLSLLAKNEPALAITTWDKALEKTTQSVTILEQLPPGQSRTDLIIKLQIALLKYQEIFNNSLPELNPDQQLRVKNMLIINQNLVNRVRNLTFPNSR